MPLAQIRIRDGAVAIIGNKVYAALFPPPNPATWTVGTGPNGTLTFTDQASGAVLCTPSTDPGTQAIAMPPPVSGAVSSWNVVEYADEVGDNATPVTNPDEMTPGFYTIQDPTSGLYLFRNRIEDRSIAPKVVALQPADQGPFELIIELY